MDAFVNAFGRITGFEGATPMKRDAAIMVALFSLSSLGLGRVIELRISVAQPVAARSVPNIMLSEQSKRARLPTFESYRVAEIFKGAKAPLVLRRHEAFSTRLKEVYARKPNFAGHYVLGDWGCGAPCRSVAIIDARTGRVVDSITVSAWAGSESFPCSIDNPMEFRLNSRLLIVYGSVDEKNKGIYYFVMGRRGLRRIRAIENIEQIKKHVGCHYQPA